MNWSLVDIYSNRIKYNDVVRPANPDLDTYITKSSLSSWDNGRWVKMFQLAVL